MTIDRDSLHNAELPEHLTYTIESVENGSVNFDAIVIRFNPGWNMVTVPAAFALEAKLLEASEPNTPVIFEFNGTPKSGNLLKAINDAAKNSRPNNLGNFYYIGETLLLRIVSAALRASRLGEKWSLFPVRSKEEAIVKEAGFRLEAIRKAENEARPTHEE